MFSSVESNALESSDQGRINGSGHGIVFWRAESRRKVASCYGNFTAMTNDLRML